MKKPFKDTKVGKFLMKKLPDLAGAALSGGPLAAIGTLIEGDATISPEEKAQLHQELVEMYELEVADRDSARNREVEMAKSGKFDFLFNLTGLVGLGAFGIVVWAILYLEIPESNKELFYHMVGIVEGVVLSIFGYYFGTSMNDKNK